MLKIRHIPHHDTVSCDINGVTVDVAIKDFSRSGLFEDSLTINYRYSAQDPYSTAQLSRSSGDLFSGTIPVRDSLPIDSVYYYIEAKDRSNRTEKVPFAGSLDPFAFVTTHDVVVAKNISAGKNVVGFSLSGNTVSVSAGIDEFSVYSLSGRLCYTSKNSVQAGTVHDLSFLGRGAYVVSAVSKLGGKMVKMYVRQ